MKKVWLVVKTRETDDHDDIQIILGVYDNFSDAVERVNEVFFEEEEEYIEQYGIEYIGDNHNNGFAELHIDYGQRDTIIKAVEYEINKPTYDTI